MKKVYTDADAALEGVLFDGMTIPAIKRNGVERLTVISNDCGANGFGLWMLLNNGHTDKSCRTKVLHGWSLPLTGAGVVDVVITDLAVFEIDKKAGATRSVELAPGIAADEVRAKTEADYEHAL